jgi:predicted  nucleic acid-binding Zn-ribbon protein
VESDVHPFYQITKLISKADMMNSNTVPRSTLSNLANMANTILNISNVNFDNTMIQPTAATLSSPFPYRLLQSAALALLLLAAGPSSSFAQRSTKAPEMVKPLKDARETIANANKTAVEMAKTMEELKNEYNRKRKELQELEKGTDAHNAKFEEVQALHSEMMKVRHEMLEKLQAAYGSAIGSLDQALQTKGEGEGLAEHLDTRGEKTRKEIAEVREEGKKLAVLLENGAPDQGYRKVLEQKLETRRHEIRVRESYLNKTKETAEQVRGSSQRALYDKLRALKASLNRRQENFKIEQRRLVDLARVGSQNLSVRQNLAVFRQFWAKMKEVSETLSGASGLAETIYEDMAQLPAIGEQLPEPEGLPEGENPISEGSSALEGTSSEVEIDFLEPDPGRGLPR